MKPFLPDIVTMVFESFIKILCFLLLVATVFLWSRVIAQAEHGGVQPWKQAEITYYDQSIYPDQVKAAARTWARLPQLPKLVAVDSPKDADFVIYSISGKDMRAKCGRCLGEAPIGDTLFGEHAMYLQGEMFKDPALSYYVILHEMGHIFGLEHDKQRRRGCSLMKPIVQYKCLVAPGDSFAMSDATQRKLIELY